MLSNELAALYARDIQRLIQELQAFPDTASIWQTAPGVTNSAGTLALHLEGNLREFIGRQMGQIAFKRDRPLEFSARGVEQAELVARLEAVRDSIPKVVAALSDAELAANNSELYMEKPITRHQFLVHLNGHLNYHLGQIDYLRRFATGSGAIDLAGL
ncbi:MAG TPA: DinB family protein [Vicinamibacterales bacterium]|nr:DinB family protein [Vicinamibacterales bacterium]